MHRNYAFKDDGQIPDTQVATFEFGENKSITCLDADIKVVKEVKTSAFNDSTNTISATGMLDIFISIILLTAYVARENLLLPLMKDINQFYFVIWQT